MDQPGLFDEPEDDDEVDPRKKRDEAIERARKGADDEWKANATQIVLRLAQHQDTLTTDDVWRCGPGPIREPRALGAIMQGAFRAGWIERTDRTVQSKRPACNAREIRVWRSKLR